MRLNYKLWSENSTYSYFAWVRCGDSSARQVVEEMIKHGTDISWRVPSLSILLGNAGLICQIVEWLARALIPDAEKVNFFESIKVEAAVLFVVLREAWRLSEIESVMRKIVFFAVAASSENQQV